MIFDPAAPEPPYWEHTDTTKDGTSRVPKGFKVKVVDGTVKMTK
jgi:hypothetical protein